MAIVFLEKKQRQKYLLTALVALIVIVPIIIWGVFAANPNAGNPPDVVSRPQKININYEVLKSVSLKELVSFEAIKAFEGEVGRENPFVAPEK